MAMADVGVSLDTDENTATVYIDGCEFVIHSKEELNKTRENIEQVFNLIERSEFGLPATNKKPTLPPPTKET